MRVAVPAFLVLLTALAAGCADPPQDLGNPDDLVLAQTLTPIYDPASVANVADGGEGVFVLGVGAPTAAPYNLTRFEATWTIMGQGLDGVVATGKGATVSFPVAHATIYEATVHLHDLLLNQTVWDKVGEGAVFWSKSADVAIPAGPPGPTVVLEVPATISGQNLEVEVSASGTTEVEGGTLTVVYPDGETSETVTSGSSVKLGEPGTYTLEWQPTLPLQTPQDVHVAAILSYGEGGHDMHDMGEMDGGMGGGEPEPEPEPGLA